MHLHLTYSFYTNSLALSIVSWSMRKSHHNWFYILFIILKNTVNHHGVVWYEIVQNTEISGLSFFELVTQ